MDGSEVRARRKALKMTQDDFATRAGVSKDYIGQIERGMVSVSPTLAAAIRSVKAGPDFFAKPTTRDPMERIIEEALIEAGIAYETDQEGGTDTALDFFLPAFGISIEVKRFYTARTTEQMARAPNVLVAQGEVAIRFLAAAIRSGDFFETLSGRQE